MSTIIAYTGNRQALPMMKEIISSQVYKGSAEYGIYVMNKHQIEFFHGKVQNPEQLVHLNTLLGLEGNQSLCFLSWESKTSANNTRSRSLTHTHDDNLALIFNGVVSNLEELKEFLEDRGHHTPGMKEADIMAVLINENLKSGDYDIRDSISTALSLIEGEYAVVAMATTDPQSLVAAMSNKTLAIGRGKQDYLVSNQSRVLLDQTKNVTYLNNNEIAYINKKQEMSIESLVNSSYSKENRTKQCKKEKEQLVLEDHVQRISQKSVSGELYRPVPDDSSHGRTRWLPGSLASLTFKAIAFQLLVLYLVGITADFAGKMVFYEMSRIQTIAAM